MTDREKLIALIASGVACPDDRDPFGEYCDSCRYEKSADCSNEKLADHLIAHGVRLEEKQATSDGWISVEERLPEEDGSYLVCTDRGSVYTSHFYAEKHFASMYVYGYTREAQWSRRGTAQVTHWMPLPKPPKEGAPNG